uniref:BED-type domain-containing protein n=1 Tax=Romanomermis culicivorax TaxID=13658 RepID=A0A915L584_ROMCU
MLGAQHAQSCARRASLRTAPSMFGEHARRATSRILQPLEYMLRYLMLLSHSYDDLEKELAFYFRFSTILKEIQFYKSGTDAKTMPSNTYSRIWEYFEGQDDDYFVCKACKVNTGKQIAICASKGNAVALNKHLK